MTNLLETMKNKVIQICGTNGTGKTTLVKGLLNSGKFRRMELPVNGVVKEWWFDGKIAVIGKYNQANCCGVDAGSYTGEQLIKVLDKVISYYNPVSVIFEDVRFGGSFKFKKAAKECAETRGYEYISIALIASMKTIYNRVLLRTGNKNVKWDNMRSKQRQVIVSQKKLKENGSTVYIIYTDKLDKEGVYKKIRCILNE